MYTDNWNATKFYGKKYYRGIGTKRCVLRRQCWNTNRNIKKVDVQPICGIRGLTLPKETNVSLWRRRQTFLSDEEPSLETLTYTNLFIFRLLLVQYLQYYFGLYRKKNSNDLPRSTRLQYKVSKDVRLASNVVYELLVNSTLLGI